MKGINCLENELVSVLLIGPIIYLTPFLSDNLFKRSDVFFCLQYCRIRRKFFFARGVIWTLHLGQIYTTHIYDKYIGLNVDFTKLSSTLIGKKDLNDLHFI